MIDSLDPSGLNIVLSVRLTSNQKYTDRPYLRQRIQIALDDLQCIRIFNKLKIGKGHVLCTKFESKEM